MSPKSKPSSRYLKQNAAPEQLAEDMRRVLALFEEAPSAMIVTAGRNHVIQMVNQSYARWINHRDIVGLPHAVAFPDPGNQRVRKLADRVYATGKSESIKGARTQAPLPDGGFRDAVIDFVLQPLRNADGSICGIFCQGREVTLETRESDELRRSRAELAAALEESQAIIETSHDLICSFGNDGVFRSSNRHVVKLLGYQPDELIGRHLMEFVHPDDIKKTRDVSVRISSGENQTGFINRWLHRDGTVVPIMWSSAWSESRQAHYCIGRDMREHAAAEEKLRQAQKMETIGRLTGGVAHDFNNLLTAVIGSAEALADALADQPALLDIVNVTLDAAGRGAELVRQMLTLSRSQPLEPQIINGAAFLSALTPILKRTIGQSISVEIGEDLLGLCCRADRNQLTSAVLNLCINARDAMPEGGRLTLSVEPAAGQVALVVRDTGEGMDEATRTRALEPFFTTKPVGAGTGLGLAMVHGFVTQSGGSVEIESVVGSGTEVKLILPAADCAEALAAPRQTVAALANPPQVMLVEDDELVRRQVRGQLEALGCAVTDFGDPYDAIDALAGEGGYDLLMTDISMPGGMNGRQLADHARLFRPDLPVLFTSGHTDDPIARGSAVGAFLPKPYRRAELARKIGEVLGAAA